MRYDPEKLREEFSANYGKLLEGVKGPLTPQKALELSDQALGKALDDIASSVDVDGLVGELVSNPRYLHICRGMPKKEGEKFHKHVGEKSYHPWLNLEFSEGTYGFVRERAEEYERVRKEKGEGRATRYEKFTREVLHKFEAWPIKILANGLPDWDFERYNPGKVGRGLENNFEITVVGSLIGNSYVFRSYWGDATHEPRRGYIGYALCIPEDEVEAKVPIIADNLRDQSQTRKILIETFRAVYPTFDNSTEDKPLRMRKGPEGVKLSDLPAA